MKVTVILLLGLARSATPKDLPRFGLTTFGEQCLGKFLVAKLLYKY